MANCRSIPPSGWEQARAALKFYFSQRAFADDVEDLVQETLKVLWAREDFEFDREEDFPLVCFGFARLVLMSGRRQRKKHASEELDTSIALPSSSAPGWQAIESAVYLAEVERLGAEALTHRDWELIRSAASLDYGEFGARFPASERGKFRLYLHRARRKLALLAGWSDHGL